MESPAEGVPDDLEDVTAVGFDGLRKQGVVPGKRLRHGRGMLLPELRAALDIGEQEGDGSSRKRMPHNWLIIIFLVGFWVRRRFFL